jgi:hypothetical protein
MKRDFHDKEFRDKTPNKDRGFIQRQKRAKKNRMKNDLKNIVDNLNSGNYNDVFDDEWNNND